MNVASGKVVGMPRWVKVLLWVALALAVIVAIMLASGHGPWQHFHSMAMPQ